MTIKHLDHVNDLVFNGYNDAKKACKLFVDLADGQADVSLKWDGSPSIFVGRFENGVFFVSTKSFLNKKPVFYNTRESIETIADKGLAEKLTSVYDNLINLNVGPGWAQGDYLFNQTTMKVVDDHMVFTPNAITYNVPVKKVDPKVGIAWHTVAGGYAALKHGQGSPDEMWCAPTKVSLMSLRDVDVADVATIVSIIESLVDGNQSWLDYVAQTKGLSERLKRFTNSLIRKGEKLDDAVTLQWKLEDWLEEDFDKEVEKRTSQKGKDKVNDHRLEVMTRLKGHEAIDMFKAYILLAALKDRFLKRVIPPFGIKAFIGDKSIAHEGVVVRTKDVVVKLIDQQEFSYHNFKRDAA